MFLNKKILIIHFLFDLLSSNDDISSDDDVSSNHDEENDGDVE